VPAVGVGRRVCLFGTQAVRCRRCLGVRDASPAKERRWLRRSFFAGTTIRCLGFHSTVGFAYDVGDGQNSEECKSAPQVDEGMKPGLYESGGHHDQPED
jgi:hypothetical protein